MVNLLPEWEKEKLSRHNTPLEGAKTKKQVSKPTKRQAPKSPVTRSSTELNKTSSGEKSEAGPKHSKFESNHLSTPRRGKTVSVEDPKLSQVVFDPEAGMEEGTYWLPRIRLMFAAEDPRMFADRVANAHKSRYICYE